MMVTTEFQKTKFHETEFRVVIIISNPRSIIIELYIFYLYFNLLN